MLNRNGKNILKKILGVLLIIIGTLGLFLPFLQGILIIIIGATLLGNKTILKKVKQLQKYLKKKFK